MAYPKKYMYLCPYFKKFNTSGLTTLHLSITAFHRAMAYHRQRRKPQATLTLATTVSQYGADYNVNRC